MFSVRSTTPLWLLALASAAACSVMLDTRSRQCDVDEDCARFGDAVCDDETLVCVPRQVIGPRGDDAGARDAAAGFGPDALAPADAPGREAALEVPIDAPLALLYLDGRPPERSCDRADKPLVAIEGDITASDTLSCDKNYRLTGTVFVKAGVTLTIEKGTTILGDVASKGTLVVQPGGQLVAVGTPDQPIVSTSINEPTRRAAGDWGGVILLGRAPVNLASPRIEGITSGGEYGGTDEDDSSGALAYVRIEYSGTKLGPNNEINGLTLGGVGRGTRLDHVQVRQTADDCFEFFGGTVNAKHLVCQYNGDDGFDWDNGYRGKLQFLVLQQDPRVVDETNGFEGDNDALGSLNTPRSAPTIYNATLCGKKVDLDREQYGILVRRATRGRIFNTVVVGFEAGLDVRDAPATEVEVASSSFSGNAVAAIAYAEDGSNASTQKNDDGGFDEVRWALAPERRNTVQPPELRDCFDANDLTALAPRVPLTTGAATPPTGDFFDPKATYLGAFRDADDPWARGRWVVWADR